MLTHDQLVAMFASAHRNGFWPAAAQAKTAAARSAAAPSAPPPSETEALAIVGQCPHARLCSCVSRGYIDCQTGGKRPGERLPPATCRECIRS